MKSHLIALACTLAIVGFLVGILFLPIKVILVGFLVLLAAGATFGIYSIVLMVVKDARGDV